MILLLIPPSVEKVSFIREICFMYQSADQKCIPYHLGWLERIEFLELWWKYLFP
jgi:hypothetical protein